MDLAVKNSIKPKTVETRNFASLQNHAVASLQNHAVVVGGSIAGMLAARALADHFTSVTIVETDKLPENAIARQSAVEARIQRAKSTLD